MTARDRIERGRPHRLGPPAGDGPQSTGRAPLLYLDAGTPNADLERAARVQPSMIVGRTVGSGHFSLLEVPDQVNAMIARFLNIAHEAAARPS